MRFLTTASWFIFAQVHAIVDSMPNKGGWDKFYIASTAALAIVAALTLLVIWHQTTEIARAAKATKKSADATLSNVKALISAERAWVIVSVAFQGPNEFSFLAENAGKTPAKIIGIYSSKTAVERDDKFEPSPEYEKGESLLSSPPCLLPPRAKIVIWQTKLAELRGHRSAEEWLSYFARGFANVYSYGKITYYDTLEANPREPHVTKWLYWHMPFEGALPIPDPRKPEFNSYT